MFSCCATSFSSLTWAASILHITKHPTNLSSGRMSSSESSSSTNNGMPSYSVSSSMIISPSDNMIIMHWLGHWEAMCPNCWHLKHFISRFCYLEVSWTDLKSLLGSDLEALNFGFCGVDMAKCSSSLLGIWFRQFPAWKLVFGWCYPSLEMPLDLHNFVQHFI